MRTFRRLARQAVSRVEKPLYSGGFFSASGLVLPDFLGLGAMKAGTTWLYENLRCHPDVFLPDKKELYYFSHRFYDGRLRRYSAQFESGADKVKGDITPGYAIVSESRIQFIRRIMPDVKLLFIARDPVNRSWSEAYMNLVAKPGRTLSEVDDSEFVRYLTTGDCRRRSDYLQILDSWSRFFPPSQLFLGTLDEIEQTPFEFLVRLFSFLGLSAAVDWARFPASKVVRPLYEENRMVYGGIVSEDRAQSHSLMPDSIRALLRQMYAPQVEELGTRYGICTDGWQ